MAKKLIGLFIVLVFIIAALTACGDDKEEGNDAKSEQTATPVPESKKASKTPKEIAGEIVAGKEDSGFVEMQESYLTGMMSLDVSKFSEYAVYVDGNGTTIDEFGIFAPAEGVSEADVEAMVRAYLDQRLASWMDEYMPEEKPKLENARIVKEGGLVLYVILGDDDANKAISVLDEACK